MTGLYACSVSNAHGQIKREFIFRVKHRPDCVVRKDSGADGIVVLTCRSSANPPVTSYVWYKDNASVVVGNQQDGSSMLTMPREDNDPARYSCVAVNGIGKSEFCKLHVPALPAPSAWVLQEENLIIVAGVAGGLLILMLLMVIAAAVVAIKRRMSAIDKPDMDERQNLEIRGCSEVSALCGKLTPPMSAPELLKSPILQEEKKVPFLLGVTPVHSRSRRFLPNNCADMYRVRDICHIDHVTKVG